jgi:RNA polymerase sigma-32 factor
MLKFVMSNYRLVKLGTTQPQRRLFFNLRKEREKLERQGLEVSPKQLAAALDVTEEEVIEMSRRLDAGDASLDAPPRGERERTMGDLMAAAESRPDVDVERSELKTVLADKLHAFAETLHGRELAIFNDRLLNDEPARLSELAVRFGLSRERVRQLETRLKLRIRDYLEEEIGDVDAIGVA